MPLFRPILARSKKGIFIFHSLYRHFLKFMHGILQYRHIRHIPSIGLHGQNRQKESALPKIGTALLRIITLFLFSKFDGLSARFFVGISDKFPAPFQHHNSPEVHHCLVVVKQAHMSSPQSLYITLNAIAFPSFSRSNFSAENLSLSKRYSIAQTSKVFVHFWPFMALPSWLYFCNVSVIVSMFSPNVFFRFSCMFFTFSPHIFLNIS